MRLLRLLNSTSHNVGRLEVVFSLPSVAYITDVHDEVSDDVAMAMFTAAAASYPQPVSGFPTPYPTAPAQPYPLVVSPGLYVLTVLD